MKAQRYAYQDEAALSILCLMSLYVRSHLSSLFYLSVSLQTWTSVCFDTSCVTSCGKGCERFFSLSAGWGDGFTHRPLTSSFLGLPYGVLNINHKQELLKGPMGNA